MTTLLATTEQRPILPDYTGGSIVNLISTIASTFGARAGSYASLRDPEPGARMRDRDRIVLMVVDGLGAQHLARHHSNSTLRRHLCGTLTSVFPSTTATAITTFLTGLAPAQHGLTGWHMYFADIDTVGAVLPLRTRRTDQPLSALGLDCEALFDHRSLFDRLPVRSFVVSPERILDSTFNRIHSGNAERRGYGSLEQFFDSTLNCLRATRQPCYIYAYFADYDSTAHQHGVGSGEAERLLRRFDAMFATFLQTAAGLNATIVVTADHGFIDSPPARVIELQDHPVLERTLRVPLCGERRAAYCYVKPEAATTFEDYVRDTFANQLWMHRSADLIAQGWFGPGEPHAQLNARAGDYTLVMKDDWTIKDWLPGEKRHRQLGVHGGVSAAEMIVPLMVAQV